MSRLQEKPGVVNYILSEVFGMIRNAQPSDLPRLYEIARNARAFMARTGNPDQWQEGYPDVYLREDIHLEQLYVLTDEGGTVHAFFAFVLGEEPSYGTIDGAWLNDRPYGTIHRIASDGAINGVLEQCLAFCRGICADIRADTHEDNKIMRHLLEKHGFVQCGYVNLDQREGDTLRVAYQYEPPIAGKE